MLHSRFLDDGRTASAFVPQAAHGAPSPARYRVLVLVRPDEVERVSALAQVLLRNTDVTVIESVIQRAGCLAQLVLVTQCVAPGRAALSRLVGQLGLERNVRSVQWESVPSFAPGNATHYQ
ncbi:hypothetical protein RA280_10835 [Cupriavidus sp. CV2]|uniref:hypothetical protein n=1 Tax=Cupriavidus ulmosensis TaxID=3065913 RepID=UPI00296AB056|nr:hypothetical protein [Cupriavidus sp. CV2]MDW3682237.1 hypothetical protein [Cupriavidus sp. CV2]